MMKQTPSPVKRLWELAGAHRRAYALSIILAILGVACGMVPYFAIAYFMLCLIDGVTALNTYALWCGIILLGFTLKLFFSTLSTTVSHTATFQTLKEVRIKIADKLSRDEQIRCHLRHQMCEDRLHALYPINDDILEPARGLIHDVTHRHP